jgi:hypothetical protein
MQLYNFCAESGALRRRLASMPVKDDVKILRIE